MTLAAGIAMGFQLRGLQSAPASSSTSGLLPGGNEEEAGDSSTRLQTQEEDRNLVVDHLARKQFLPKCPACGHDGFAMGTKEVSAPYAQGALGFVTPTLPIICQRCHHVMYFALLALLNAARAEGQARSGPVAAPHTASTA